jgi:molybdate transport system regulatory protein
VRQPSMRKSSPTSLPTLSIRIDLDTDGRIGPGKIQLLETIRTCGSISAAGRAMNMSYKRAWDLVDDINRICRRAAVERQKAVRMAAGLSSRRLASLSSHVTGKSNAL